MKKFYGQHQDTNIRNYYILTRPTRLSDMSFDDWDGDQDDSWRDKARQLQARRWRKIKHQLI